MLCSFDSQTLCESDFKNVYLIMLMYGYNLERQKL